MNSAAMAEKSQYFHNAKFEFVDIGFGGAQICTVLERQNAMVIDIPRQDEIDPCLIEGLQRENAFPGENTRRSATTAPRIQAKWTNLGNRFVGLWIEEGNDSFFWFELTRRATRAVKNSTRHENVKIEFLPLADVHLLTGDITVRDDLMRIKLHRTGKFPGITIDGRRAGNVFNCEIQSGLIAMWRTLISGFIGIIESKDEQSLFSFRLPEKQRTRKSRDRKG